MQRQVGMPCLLDNLRLLEAAQGYSELGLYMQANQELEQMSAETRHWPEVLAVKLGVFDGLRLWEMVEIVAMQLADSAAGNPRWISMAEIACRETRAARRRESSGGVTGAREAGVGGMDGMDSMDGMGGMGRPGRLSSRRGCI